MRSTGLSAASPASSSVAAPDSPSSTRSKRPSAAAGEDAAFDHESLDGYDYMADAPRSKRNRRGSLHGAQSAHQSSAGSSGSAAPAGRGAGDGMQLHNSSKQGAGGNDKEARKVARMIRNRSESRFVLGDLLFFSLAPPDPNLPHGHRTAVLTCTYRLDRRCSSIPGSKKGTHGMARGTRRSTRGTAQLGAVARAGAALSARPGALDKIGFGSAQCHAFDGKQ